MLNLKDPSLLRQQCFIDGEWCDANDASTFTVTNPATGETVGTAPHMGAAETKRAIDAANAAWPAWRKTSAKERSNILRKWNDLMLANADDLALIMTAEQGKPLPEARGEVAYAASFLEWFGEEAKRIEGDTLQSPWADRRLVVTREPIGVCAAITPWNFPAAMITRKVGPALGAGCPIVVKPAELTPFSALALAVLAERAGVPKGVFSVITGDSKSIGLEMTSNPVVRKVSFTGSTQVGRILMHPPSRNCRWNWAATRRSSCSTTPTSVRRSRAPSRRNTAMPDRPACAPTACTCRTGSTTGSPRSWSKRSPN
jgi:succinate-semialdehyde dehydrogenase/glutarate-semialdehyde dehydrogenase